MTRLDVLQRAVYFPGEVEALEEELCGGFPTPFARLAPLKWERLAAWLAYPTEQRQAAFEAVKGWANAPIAAALGRLKDPAKFAAKGKRAAGAATHDAIDAFLAEDDAP